MVHKHITYGIVVYLEVNLQAKTSQRAKPDPMCKNKFSQIGKKQNP